MSEPVETPDGYHICPKCGHHTSAYYGTCTAYVSVEPLETCGCDCRVEMGGPTIAEILWGKDVSHDR